MIGAIESVLTKAPPADLEKNLSFFRVHLQEAGQSDLPVALDVKYPIPWKLFEVDDDDVSGEKSFLLGPFNAVQGSSGSVRHRSPWTNQLYPQTSRESGKNIASQGQVNDLRQFEITMNGVWDAYKNLYYGHGKQSVGSVYVKELSEKEDFTMSSHGFHAYFGISKTFGSEATTTEEEDTIEPVPSGIWHSFHHVTVANPEEKSCNYHVESSVLFVVAPIVPDVDVNGTTDIDISAILRKETTRQCKIQQTSLAACHIENMGQIIEANEIELRTGYDRVNVPKLQEIVDGIQKPTDDARRGLNDGSSLGVVNGAPPQSVGVNPLMGLIMGSEVLKKKLAQEHSLLS